MVLVRMDNRTTTAADAFAVLLSQSQQQSSSKKRKSTDQKDKYVPCPICGSSVPKTFIQSHTEGCLVKSQRPSKASKHSPHDSPAAAAAAAATTSPAADTATAAHAHGGGGGGGSTAAAATQPPPPQRSPQQPAAAKPGAARDAPQPRPFLSPRQRLPPDEFRAMVSASWDRALKHMPGALEGAPVLQQQQQQLLPPPQHAQPAVLQAPHAGGRSSAPAGQPPAPAPGQAPAPLPAAGGAGAGGAAVAATVDAFAVLRSAQAAQVPMEAVMFLQGRPDGTWAWHWGLAGDPWLDQLGEDVAWSSSINANLPKQQQHQQSPTAHTFSSSSSMLAGIPTGSAKLRLEIMTNVPPGFGTAVDWDNPLLPSNGLAWEQQGHHHQGYDQQQAYQQQQQQQQQDGRHGHQREALCDEQQQQQQETEGASEGRSNEDAAGQLQHYKGLPQQHHQQLNDCTTGTHQHHHHQQQQSCSTGQQEGAVVDATISKQDAPADSPAAAAAASAAGSNAPRGGVMRWRGGGPGVLISALQKSIRRGQAGAATRIALELLKEPRSCEALLRRLSIICLEDGLLHPGLPLVVWCMLAVGKGYTLGGSLANALLHITHQMASVPHRDYVPPPHISQQHQHQQQANSTAAAVYTAPSTWHAVDAALGVSSPEALLVKCILIRAAYGGMSGDKDMLMAYAGLWTARFTGCTLPPPPLARLAQQQVQQQQQRQVQQQVQQQQPEQECLGRPCKEVQKDHHQQDAAATQVLDQDEQQQQLDEDHKRQQQDHRLQQQQQHAEPADDAVQQQQPSLLQQQEQKQGYDASGDEQLQHQQQHSAGGGIVRAAGSDAAAKFTSNDADPPAAAAAAAGDVSSSPWLRFLQCMYGGLDTPGARGGGGGAAAAAGVTRVTNIGAVSREDVPLAAVDFHVAPGLTQHLMAQPALKAVVRSLITSSTAVAARLSAPDGLEGLINSTLWLFRSSINRKTWLQGLYLQAAAAAATGDRTTAAGGCGAQFPCSKQPQLEAAAAAAFAAWSDKAQVPAAGEQLPSAPAVAAGLRVLELELASLTAHEAETRQRRQQLLPLWREMAQLTDAWSRDYISRRLY